MSWRSKSKWMSSSSARAANSAGAGRADPSGGRGSDVPGDAAPGDDAPGDVVPGDAVPGRVVTSVSGVTGDSVAAAPPERGGAGAAARGGAETSTVTVRFAHAATIAAGTSIETANAQIRWFIMIPPGFRRVSASASSTLASCVYGAVEAPVDDLDGRGLDPIWLVRIAGPLESEPIEPVRADAHEVGGHLDRREDRAAEDLDRPDPGEFAEVELGRLRRAGQVRDDQHRLAPIPPQAREDLLVARAQELDRAAPEHGRGAARGDQPLHRVEERRGLPRLRGDVHRLVAVDGIGDHGEVELTLLRRREARVPVARPLHRRAHAVAVAEVDVVAHSDLVAIVDDRAARQRQQERVQQLDPPPVVVEERRQPP